MITVHKPKIGILSGLGPLAGSHVLAKVFEYSALQYQAKEDSDYPEVVLVSHGIEDFDETATTGKHFERELIKSVQQLELLSPNVIGIACNTAHLYIDKLKKYTEAELINLIEETARVAAKYEGTYLLLTSPTTRSSKLYHPYLKQFGVKFTELKDSEQKIVDNIIGLVMAHDLEEAGAKISKLIASKPKKNSGIIVGCTEIPIAINHADLAEDLILVDSSQVLAEVLTDTYYKLLTTTI